MNSHISKFVALIFVGALIIISFNCSKTALTKSNRLNADTALAENQVAKPNPEAAASSKKLHGEQPLSSIDAKSQAVTAFATGTYGCGSFIEDEYLSHGYHLYTGYTLDLSSTPLGATVTLTLNSFEVPNRFAAYDASHHLVAQSGWMGFAGYSGPWGATLNTAQHQTITFKRNLSTNYTLEVETSVNTASDNWTVSVSCAYTPNITITPFTDATTTNTMLSIFRSLSGVNFTELGTELGISGALTESKIDFVHLFKSRDASQPDSGWAISAAFTTNSNSNTNNYVFTIFTDGTNYFKPVIEKSVTNVKQQFFDLTDATITTITNYKTTSASFATTVGAYMRTGPGCGQAVANCVANAYVGHGWASVWAFVQTAFLPETAVAITLQCAIKNCQRIQR